MVTDNRGRLPLVPLVPFHLLKQENIYKYNDERLLLKEEYKIIVIIVFVIIVVLLMHIICHLIGYRNH